MCVRSILSVYSVHSRAVVKGAFCLFRPRYSRAFSYEFWGCVVPIPVLPWGRRPFPYAWVGRGRVRSILVGPRGHRVPFPCSLGGVGLVEMRSVHSPEVVGFHSLTLWWSLGCMSVGCFFAYGPFLRSPNAPRRHLGMDRRTAWHTGMGREHPQQNKPADYPQDARTHPYESQCAWDGTRPPSGQGAREWAGTTSRALGNGKNAHEP